jgi:hypothetical protein
MQHSPQQEGLLKSVLLKSDAGDTLLPSHPGPASPAFNASFNEQIKHIIRKLHAVFVQPQQQQDESLCGMMEHQMIFARPIDQIPDFDRPVPVPIPILSPGPDLVARSRHDLGPVRGKRHRVDAAAVSVRLLAQQLQLGCQTKASRRQFRSRRGNLRAPAHPNPRL